MSYAPYFLFKCRSTQHFASYLLEIQRIREGDIVCSTYQSQGEGQRGRKWMSRPGENLLFTYVVKPESLPLHKLFLLNVVASLAICEVLTNYQVEAQIKWPNDVFVKGKKVAGILLTRKVVQHTTYTLIGVGMNVNQTEDLPVGGTSLARQTGRKTDLEEVLKLWHLSVLKYSGLLQDREEAKLCEAYNHKLLYRNELRLFRHNYLSSFYAKILKIDRERGFLVLNKDGELLHISQGELQYL